MSHFINQFFENYNFYNRTETNRYNKVLIASLSECRPKAKRIIRNVQAQRPRVIDVVEVADGNARRASLGSPPARPATALDLVRAVLVCDTTLTWRH